MTPIDEYSVSGNEYRDIQVPIGLIKISDSSLGTDCGIYVFGTTGMTELYKSNTFTNQIVVSFLGTDRGKASIRVTNNFSSTITIYIFLR